MEVLQLLMRADNIMFICTRRTRKQPVHTGNDPNVPFTVDTAVEKKEDFSKGSS